MRHHCLLALTAAALVTVGGWCAAAEFVPPGPNLALHKPYTMEPAPNYGDCADAGDATQLTDGAHALKYFWVDPATVGWVRTCPVAVTIDLGQVEPLAGVSYSTAAGVADVTWPLSIRLLASEEGSTWRDLGELVSLANKAGAPAPHPYALHRFATGELQGRGRYLALIIDQTPYTVVDEIEVYRGPEALLRQAPTGRPYRGLPLAIWKQQRLATQIQSRLRADLAQIVAGIEPAPLPAADRGALRERAAALGREIAAVEAAPAGFTTLLPLDLLHRRIYELNAPLLRARGYRDLDLQPAYRYDPLDPLRIPGEPGPAPRALTMQLARGEHRAETLNFVNSSDRAAEVLVTGRGGQEPPPWLRLRHVLFTDTLRQTPIGAGLSDAAPAYPGLRVTVPAGTIGQVWLDVNSRGLAPGEHRAQVEVNNLRGRSFTVALTVRVAPATLPAELSCAIGGWDETNNKGGYEVTAGNMQPLIALLREYGVNMPWSNPQVMPTPGSYDAAGALTAPPDFSAWDEWVGRWAGAKHWGLFPSVRPSFAGEPMGTPRFNRMVGAWATAWMQHARAQGIAPGQIKLLLVDEPRSDEQDQVIIAWAKAIKAAQPELVIWNDPLHEEPAKVDPQFYELADVLCPNAPRFLAGGKDYQEFYLAQQRAGRELWFYSCSGPGKLLDPATYWRGQFWLNLKYGGKGSCYWAFGDEAGDSWNAYAQTRAQYSPLFLGKTSVTTAKQMEALREGAEDYEYFLLLRQKVAEAEGKGVQSEALTAAKALLESGPRRVVAEIDPAKLQWAEEKHRAVMDEVRLQALALLEKL